MVFSGYSRGAESFPEHHCYQYLVDSVEVCESWPEHHGNGYLVNLVEVCENWSGHHGYQYLVDLVELRKSWPWHHSYKKKKDCDKVNINCLVSPLQKRVISKEIMPSKLVDDNEVRIKRGEVLNTLQGLSVPLITLMNTDLYSCLWLIWYWGVVDW